MIENYTENVECKHCGSSMTFWWDGGKIKGQFWNAYKCADCGKITSDEPDIDLMFTKKYNR